MAEIGCYACRRSYGEVHWYCYRFVSYLGRWFNFGENIFVFLTCCFFSLLYMYLLSMWCSLFFFSFFFFLTLSWFINSCIIRRAKVGEVMHQIQMLKDRWDQFSALLFMRRNLEMSCKVLRTSQYKSPLFSFKALIISAWRWFHGL